MTLNAQKVLTSFDELSEQDQREVAREVVRRLSHDEYGEIPDEAFVAAAEELFLELDAREAQDANAQPR